MEANVKSSLKSGLPTCSRLIAFLTAQFNRLRCACVYTLDSTHHSLATRIAYLTKAAHDLKQEALGKHFNIFAKWSGAPGWVEPKKPVHEKKLGLIQARHGLPINQISNKKIKILYFIFIKKNLT